MIADSAHISYAEFIDAANQGLCPAIVPVVKDGKRSFHYTAGSFIPDRVKTDEEVLALALVACNATYEQAFSEGAFPRR